MGVARSTKLENHIEASAQAQSKLADANGSQEQLAVLDPS